MDLRRETLRCFQQTNLKYKDTKRWKIKGLRKIYHTKTSNNNNKKKQLQQTSNKAGLKEEVFLDRETLCNDKIISLLGKIYNNSGFVCMYLIT